MDEDYEFDKSDDESSEEDDEMRANMLRLVARENEENGTDSGYSEDGSLKRRHPTMLDHSYSRAVPTVTPRPPPPPLPSTAPALPTSVREAKGVDALLHLANLASRELEHIMSTRNNQSPDSSSSGRCSSRDPADVSTVASLPHANMSSDDIDMLNQTSASSEDSAIDFTTETHYGVTTTGELGCQTTSPHLHEVLEETSMIVDDSWRCCDSPPQPVETAEKSCQFNSIHSRLQSP